MSLFSPSNSRASVLTSQDKPCLVVPIAHRLYRHLTFRAADPGARPTSFSLFRCLSPFRLPSPNFVSTCPLSTPFYRPRLPAAPVTRRRSPFSNEDACLRFPPLFSSRNPSPLRNHTDSSSYSMRLLFFCRTAWRKLCGDGQGALEKANASHLDPYGLKKLFTDDDFSDTGMDTFLEGLPR